MASEPASQTNDRQDRSKQIASNAGGKTGRRYLPNPKRQKEGELEDMRASFLEAIERERQRMTRDIHDLSGQYIVGALFQLNALENNIVDQSLRPHFADLRAMLSRLSEELHEVAAGGHPGIPRGCALITALSELIAQWERRAGISARFRYDGPEGLNLDDLTAEAVFRIVQEALSNVAKHAVAASLVTVQLKVLSNGVVLAIEDNGTGPNRLPDTLHSPKHMGLAGMMERVAELGGDFTIAPRAGGGIRLVATLSARPADALYAKGGRQ